MNTAEQEDKDFRDWLFQGVDRGWVSDPFCSTHDGGLEYMGEEEREEWDAGGDPCATVLRIFYDQ